MQLFTNFSYKKTLHKKENFSYENLTATLLGCYLKKQLIIVANIYFGTYIKSDICTKVNFTDVLLYTFLDLK